MTSHELPHDFNAAEAPYIREREWHPSQQIEERPGGRIRLTLNVVIDWGLQAWVMGFGPAARVVQPAKFADAIVKALDETRRIY